MSSFSDKDLKRLKEYASDTEQKGTWIWSDRREYFQRLLARLEAAEPCIKAQVNEIIPNTLEYEVYERWRKASGNAGDSAESGAGK